MAPMAGGSMVPAGEGGRSPVETLFAAAGDDQEALLAMIEERYGDMAAATTPGERAGLAKQLRSMWVLAFERDLSRVANLIFPKMSKELALDEALNQ